MNNLVLSLFPGIGLLDRAFEEEGFCVVRGPDALWGGDIHSFHPPTGIWDGVIGGPPCQIFSMMRHLNAASGARHGNLIPEFERVVAEAAPRWFLMENVPEAPVARVEGYVSRPRSIVDGWVGGATSRERIFTLGTPQGAWLEIPKIAAGPPLETGVVAGHSGVGRERGRSTQVPIDEFCRRQGLPPDFADELPFTMHGKRRVIGNGVPLPMGRAVAQAVKRSLEDES